MPNDTLYYSSGWDIDQILYQGEITGIVLPANTTSLSYISLYTFSLDFPPVVDATFQLAGDTVWRQLNDPTVALNQNMFIAITSTGISLAYYNYDPSLSVTITVRYYIWTDRIDN